MVPPLALCHNLRSMSNLPPPPPPPPGPPLPSGPDPSSLTPGGPPPPGPDGSGLPLASWGRRLAAYILDAILWVIVLVVIFTLTWDSESLDRDNEGTMGSLSIPLSASSILLVVFVSLILGGLFTGLWGRTPGKAALKLKVVSADDHSRTVGFGRGTVREAARGVVNFIPFVGFLLFLVDHLWPLWDAQNQALHDKVIRSHVVYTGGS